MTRPTGAPIRKSSGLTAYRVGWTIFGTLGAAYIAVALFMPDVLDEWTPAALASRSGTAAETQLAVTALSSDLSDLRAGVSQIKNDVTAVRIDVTRQGERASALEQRIAALEQNTRDKDLSSQAAPGSEPSAGAVSPPADAPDTHAAAPPPAPVQPVKVLNRDSGAKKKESLETGSVAKPKSDDAISFGPAVVKPTARPFGLKLMSGSSIDTLRLNWSLLSDQHGQTLSSLQPRFVTSGRPENPNYDLIAGPLKTKAAAIKACNDLVAQNVPCKVGAFEGDAF